MKMIVDSESKQVERSGRLRPCVRANRGHYFGMNLSLRWLAMSLAVVISLTSSSSRAAAASRPNIILILADDMGYSDLGSYGSEISTPNLDKLANNGLRFTQFYNGARCCPTRAALLTGLYPHQAGVGHMLQDLKKPGYTTGLNDHSATIAELLRETGYRTYHVGKWHVGGIGAKAEPRNHPMSRGFDRAYGSGGGGNYFALQPLYLDRENIKPGDNFYATDAFSYWAVKFLDEHQARHKEQPFFMHLCYTAPHFPLHAKPEDIAKYRGKYRAGWDKLREARFAKQQELGIVDKKAKLSPRDPVAKAWEELPEAEKDEWDLRMAVHAAMIDCMDQGIGRVMEMVKKMGAEENTLVVVLSDNGASAEALDSWPNPGRGHKPGSVTGTRESHRCIEIGWANAANTPFRENKMWTHEGGICTSFIAHWPAGITKTRGKITGEVGHIIDLMPTFLELAGGSYPARYRSFDLKPLAGTSLVPVLQGKKLADRTLGWEHEGNRAFRDGDWKLVAMFKGEWELYDLSKDRAEVNNLAAKYPKRVQELAARYQQWADEVGVVPWEQLPGANYKPTKGYQKKSEPVP
jgi:arylsulfatase A-like enzyme